ncbi:hypothetical protein OAE57_01075 [Synechococcus sp. AH-551-C10]|nr:hypothetical protein [Synechococcus sp. AH-551-C10]MDB4659645.1 hypothetical protein [Synechococcus sp. AH-551-C10]
MLVNFDSSIKSYVVSDDVELTHKTFIQFFEEASLLPRRENIFLSSVTISELSLEYYDRCLAHYCKQTSHLGIRHKDTCWVKNCENIVSLGPSPFFAENVDLLYPKSNRKGLTAWFIRYYLLQKVIFDQEGWGFLRYLPPLDFSVKGLLIRAKHSFFTRFGIRNRDRVLDIVNSIIKEGWSNSLAISPHPSVLIYHRPTKKFSVHTGRHRIAALYYLYNSGRVPGNLLINAVILSVPWGPLRTGRPYPGIVRCDNCIE